MKIIRWFKSVKRFFSRNIILRKFITILTMLFLWIGLQLGAIFSPNRERYTAQQLEPSQTFSNGSGEISLVKQTYSSKNNLIILEFETSDNLSNLGNGINPKNLKWKLYAKNKSDKTEMEVIPIIDNKISAVIRNIPTDFEAIAVDVKNLSVDSNNIDLNVEDYDEVKSDQTVEKNDDNVIQFIISEKSEELKHKKITDVSREDFALKQLKSEKSFQLAQKNKLEKSIHKLERSIAEDEVAKENLQRESEYLVGEDKVSNENNITSIDRNIENKNNSITTATENIENIKHKVESINKKIEDVKSGDFEFSSPVQKVQVK
ncbi:hypothetical protein [Enterococcus avium]|uniref:hypothetical protein n=1 Tax=Enterococcus avium TaxID=33945 RepID=UPI0028921775|nr:hypothetical protein [Enterococcus avium]MDT2482610.1 hypothetical protein [Enterococcus avium]MDT2509306.1 hypothetical protein [Enterococcus avium]